MTNIEAQSEAPSVDTILLALITSLYSGRVLGGPIEIHENGTVTLDGIEIANITEASAKINRLIDEAEIKFHDRLDTVPLKNIRAHSTARRNILKSKLSNNLSKGNKDEHTT